MMNGTCCLWQMQQEEERRESLRRDFRMEYERHRLIDRELQIIAYQQQRDERESSDRRQKIMAAKSAVLREQSRWKNDNDYQEIHSQKELNLLRGKESKREGIKLVSTNTNGGAAGERGLPPRIRPTSEPQLMPTTGPRKGTLVSRNISYGQQSDHSDKSSLISIPLDT